MLDFAVLYLKLRDSLYFVDKFWSSDYVVRINIFVFDTLVLIDVLFCISL